MKILHLMKDEKFTGNAVSFYDTFFPEGDHEICYINIKGKPSLIRDEFKIKQREFYYSGKKGIKGVIEDGSAFSKLIKEYDYIVLHSMFPHNQIISVLARRKNIKKVIWIEWGYDLYNKDKSSGIKGKLMSSLRRKLKENCRIFVGIFPPDCDYYKEKFPNSTAQVFYAPYGGPSVQQQYRNYTADSNLQRHGGTEDEITLLVGHNASSVLNHIDVLRALAKYKDKNIKIILPLSYGGNNTEEYADNVQSFAEKEFPGKVVCLREMMPKDKYFEILDGVDIAIFNTARQMGLGNINRLIFKNTKIYMPRESIMYKYFKKRGVPIQEFEQIGECSYEELVSVVKPDFPELFSEFISDLSDMKKRVGYWQTIYNSLR